MCDIIVWYFTTTKYILAKFKHYNFFALTKAVAENEFQEANLNTDMNAGKEFWKHRQLWKCLKNFHENTCYYNAS